MSLRCVFLQELQSVVGIFLKGIDSHHFTEFQFHTGIDVVWYCTLVRSEPVNSQCIKKVQK